MTAGARRGIEHKVTANATMYPGSGPSGVEVIPIRPVVSVYINGVWVTKVLLELHGERRKKLYLACSTREPRESRERVTKEARGPFI